MLNLILRNSTPWFSPHRWSCSRGPAKNRLAAAIPISRIRRPMSTSHAVYQVIDGAERLHYYQPGGYHPVEIGDCLHDWAMVPFRQHGWRTMSKPHVMLLSK